MHTTYQYRRSVAHTSREELYALVDAGDRSQLRRWHNAEAGPGESGLVAAFEPLELDRLIDECGGFGAFVEDCIGASEWESAVARGRPRSPRVVDSELVRRFRAIYRNSKLMGKE